MTHPSPGSLPIHWSTDPRRRARRMRWMETGINHAFSISFQLERRAQTPAFHLLIETAGHLVHLVNRRLKSKRPLIACLINQTQMQVLLFVSITNNQMAASMYNTWFFLIAWLYQQISTVYAVIVPSNPDHFLAGELDGQDSVRDWMGRIDSIPADARISGCIDK